MELKVLKSKVNDRIMLKHNAIIRGIFDKLSDNPCSCDYCSISNDYYKTKKKIREIEFEVFGDSDPNFICTADDENMPLINELAALYGIGNKLSFKIYMMCEKGRECYKFKYPALGNG